MVASAMPSQVSSGAAGHDGEHGSGQHRKLAAPDRGSVAACPARGGGEGGEQRDDVCGERVEAPVWPLCADLPGERAGEQQDQAAQGCVDPGGRPGGHEHGGAGAVAAKPKRPGGQSRQPWQHDQGEADMRQAHGEAGQHEAVLHCRDAQRLVRWQGPRGNQQQAEQDCGERKAGLGDGSGKSGQNGAGGEG